MHRNQGSDAQYRVKNHVRASILVLYVTVHLIDVPDVLLCDHLQWSSNFLYSPVFHQNDAVGIPGCYVEVMADHQDDHALLDRQGSQKLCHIYLVFDVEVRRRLVQNQDFRLLDDAPADGNLLVLTCGELVRAPHGQVRDAHHPQYTGGDLHIPVGGLPFVSFLSSQEDRV